MSDSEDVPGEALDEEQPTEEATTVAADESAEAAAAAVANDLGFGPDEAEEAEAESESEESESDDDDDDDDDDRAGLLGGWLYLFLLFVVFLGLALAAYGCDDDAGRGANGSGGSPAGDVTEAADHVALDLVVNGDQVTLRGAVPDEATRAQLIALAEARYPDGTIVDELTIDSGLTLVGGTVSVLGTADAGDDRPEGLLADAQAALGLSAGSFGINFNEVELTPMNVEATVSADGVSLEGAVPDESIHSSVLAAAVAQWGEGNVDSSGFTIDDLVTLDGGQFNMSGTVDAGDVRAARFAAALGDFGIQTSADAVAIDTSSDALGRLEGRLRDQLSANPILFALGSAEIDPASDAILQDAAAAITAAPDIAVEIVGHTDSSGSADTNLELSEERAAAVMERLIELGVDSGRLTARGAGDTEPVADNDTEEGRAANRRIAFEFEGAADQQADQNADEATEEEE